MLRKLGIVGALLISGVLVFAPSVSAQRRVFIRPSFGFGYYGPVYPMYGPYPYYGAPYYYGEPNTGEVKLETNLKDAQVYVDGGLLGVAKKFKSFHLEPGNHTIELRDNAGTVLFERKIEVLQGHTTDVDAKGIAG